MEITKREIIASVSIIAILLVIGILISGRISDNRMDKNETYNKAVKIDNADMFEYGMRTNVGNAFVYGDLEAVDTVTYPEIGGKYMKVERVEEHYTMHTKTVTYTDANGNTKTRIETYWTWDTVDVDRLRCKEITFLGVKFDSNKIDLPRENYIDTIKESSHVRFKYYGTSTKHTGTIFAELKDKTIQKGTNFYKDYTIEDTVKRLETGVGGLVLFWFFWIILMILSVCGFYYLDNSWLE